MTTTATHTVSGLLTKRDVKRLTKLTRAGTVGPTAVYYAGVTAPVISAGISQLIRGIMEVAGMSEYWTWFASAMIAALAGITWYLVFTRLSYRTKHGRGNEMTEATDLELNDTGIVIKRGPITTHIDWSAVGEVRDARGFTAIVVDGADAIIVPDQWFKKDKEAIKSFQTKLIERGAN